MQPHYVLIDYENVQPKDLARLNGQPYEVVVFVGANQTKIPFELAAALQVRGQCGGRYVQISGNGRNALDFHIAFHLGELTAKNSGASFCVISRDGGFDPLIDYLRSKQIDVRRSASLDALLPPPDETLAVVIDRLRSMGPARPRRTKTLASTINAVFGKKLDERAIQALIEALAGRRVISVKEGKVTYSAFKVS
jgi:hypothetical protein